MIMNHKDQQTLEHTQWSYPSVEVKGKKPQYGSHCFLQHLAHTLRYYCLEPYVDRSAASLKPKSQPWASKLVCKLVSVQDIAKCNNKRARTHTRIYTNTDSHAQKTNNNKKNPTADYKHAAKSTGGHPSWGLDRLVKQRSDIFLLVSVSRTQHHYSILTRRGKNKQTKNRLSLSRIQSIRTMQYASICENTNYVHIGLLLNTWFTTNLTKGLAHIEPPNWSIT